MSSIIRWRSGLTVLVSLMGSSILSEVDEHLDSQDGALHPLLASLRPVKGLSGLAPAQRAGAQRLCAFTRTRHSSRCRVARSRCTMIQKGRERFCGRDFKPHLLIAW